MVNNDDLQLYRLGPVTYFGHISAIAPHESAPPRTYSGILTNIGNGGGFSGSPIILPESGAVVGIHYAGNNTHLGLGIPLDAERVDGFVKIVEAGLSTGSIFKSTFAGDAVVNQSVAQ